MEVYQVRLRGNFWGGHYYEIGLDSIFVLAENAENARNITKSNILNVERHFRKKIYYGGKRAISKRDMHHFKDNDVGKATLSKNMMSYNKLLHINGVFGKL